MDNNKITPADRNGLVSEKEGLERDIQLLRSRKDHENNQLDLILRSVNEAKLEHERITDDIVILKRQRENDQKLTEEYQEKRIGNETVLDVQEADIRRNTTELSILTSKIEALKKEEAKFKEGASKREEAERARISTLMTKEFADLKDDIAHVKSEANKAQKLIDDELKRHATLLEQNTTLKTENETLSKKVGGANEALENVSKALLEAEKTKKSLGDTIATLESNKESLSNEVTALSAAKAKNINDITEQTVQIKKLEEEINNKKVEFKKEEKRLFNIVEREQRINQRETFIKERYERAGVDYR